MTNIEYETKLECIVCDYEERIASLEKELEMAYKAIDELKSKNAESPKIEIELSRYDALIKSEGTLKLLKRALSKLCGYTNIDTLKQAFDFDD